MSKFYLFLFMLFPQIWLGADNGWVNENSDAVSDEEIADFMEANISDEIKKMATDGKTAGWGNFTNLQKKIYL